MTKTERTAPRILPWLVALLAGPPTLCALALAVLRPADAPWPLAVSLLAATLALVLAARHATPRRARIVLASMPFVLLLWPEMGLRAAGFRHDHALVMQFGFPAPELMVKMRHDPELFWKLPTDYPGANSEGFIGPEFRTPKPAGTFRMVFLGDSCTMQGFPSLVPPAMTPVAGRTFEAINLGVAGYTSHQGVVLAKRWANVLEPDLVVVCYGWNDHWLAHGAPDSDKTAPGWRRLLEVGVRATRTTQWLASRKKPEPPLAVQRVSPDRYQSNLEAIGDIFTAAGARVLLLTAPTSAEVIGAPDLLIPTFATSKQAIVDLHKAYNQRVRDVAARRGWQLLDLANEIPADKLAEMIPADAVHYSDAGLVWVARRIARQSDELAK